MLAPARCGSCPGPRHPISIPAQRPTFHKLLSTHPAPGTQHPPLKLLLYAAQVGAKARVQRAYAPLLQLQQLLQQAQVSSSCRIVLVVGHTQLLQQALWGRERVYGWRLGRSRGLEMGWWRREVVEARGKGKALCPSTHPAAAQLGGWLELQRTECVLAASPHSRPLVGTRVNPAASSTHVANLTKPPTPTHNRLYIKQHLPSTMV